MASSIKPPRDSGLRIRIAPEEVQLRVWPLVERPVGSLIAFALAAGASWLVARVTGRWEAGFVATALLAITLWRTWLPVRYEIGGGGIVQVAFGRRRRIPWAAILRYEVRPGGVLLLPDATLTPLSPLRGLYLPWGQQRSGLLASCEYYLGPWSDGRNST